MSAELEVQRAIYIRLNESPGLDLDYAVGVFDHVPQDEDYPYICLEGQTAQEFDTKTFNGFEVPVLVHSWSRYDGNKEIAEIMGAVYDALHNQSVHVEGYNFVHCLWEFSEMLTESDGLTRHGIQRFNLLITQE
jgi:hypothetical protein